MRRYMLAIWILSVFYFALAAPVAVKEKTELRSDAVDVFKDVIVVWEKRWDSPAEDPMSEVEDPTSEDEQNNDSSGQYDASDSDNVAAVDGSDSNDSDDDGDGDNYDYEDNVSEDNNDNTAIADPINDSKDESDRGGDTGYDGDHESDGGRLPETPEHMGAATYVEELLDRLRPARR
jgi:hypothetical protein